MYGDISMNDRQKMNSLKYLLNEVMSEKKINGRVSRQLSRQSNINEITLNAMLKSGFFTVNESTALNVLFSASNTKSLNESTIHRIDGIVNTVVESIDSNKVLTEGFLGDIWDGLKKLGNKAKDALSGGWNKVKAIWGEFKELAEAFVEVMKDGFRKGLDTAKKFAMEQVNSVKDEIMVYLEPVLEKLDSVAEEKQFANEVVNAYETGQWVVTQMKGNVVEKGKWADDVVKGNGQPEEPPAIDPKAMESGFEDLKQEEGIQTSKKLTESRTRLFSNPNFLRELYVSSQKRLNEGGAGAVHLEDAIKNQWLKKAVHWCVSVFQWALIPLAKAAQEYAQKKGPELLETASKTVDFLGGPGIYKFPMIGLIVAEILEIVIKTFAPGTKDAAKWIAGIFYPPLVPILATADTAISIIKTVLLVYTVGTILFNLIVSIRKAYTDWKIEKAGQGGEGGGEPEVQTAGYKPKGSFKLKEGKLIFVQ
jgi:hypothetical protein